MGIRDRPTADGPAVGEREAHAVEKETSSISSQIIGKDSIGPTVSVSVISPETIGEYISS